MQERGIKGRVESKEWWVERGEDIQYIHIRQSEHYLETILVSLRQFSKLNSICLR